jgi:hypothetical protein
MGKGGYASIQCWIEVIIEEGKKTRSKKQE